MIVDTGTSALSLYKKDLKAVLDIINKLPGN